MFGMVSSQDRTGKPFPTNSEGTRRLLFPLAIITLICLSSCASRQPLNNTPDAANAEMGVYRARLTDRTGNSKKFKLLIFAELPDRLHGEIISPIGSTVAIFDGGAGLLSVALLRERLAFVGSSGPQALERVCGLPISLGDLVRGLLDDDVHQTDYTLMRTPADDGGLPAGLTITAGGQTLQLELKRKQTVRGPTASLGTGQPPAGLEIHPLEELNLYPLPLDAGS
jgi:hypothetical protein